MATLEIDLPLDVPVDVAAFRRDGFLRFERIATARTAGTLRAAYDDIIEGRAGTLPTDVQLGNVTRQIMYPHRYFELFADNPALAAGRAIARELLGCAEPKFWFDMLIYKPPGHRPESHPTKRPFHGGRPPFDRT